ncbi:MAG: calcium-binding protein [Hyphomonadaceae bacterium]
MTWNEFLAELDWFDSSDLWGQSSSIISHVSGSEQSAIQTHLLALFNGSQLARSELTAVAGHANGLRIAHAVGGVPAFASDPSNLIALDLTAVADSYYINQHGELIREDPRITIIHEVLHLTKGVGDLPVPHAGNSPTEAEYDAYLNGANADHRGSIVFDPSGVDQGDIQGELNISDRQVSYLAALVNSDLRYGQLQTLSSSLGAASFTDGNEIDIARFGDLTQNGANNTIDHRQNTTLLRDLIFGFGGNDTIYSGDGDDYVYGGGGADHIYGGDGNDVLYGEADSDTLIDGGIGNDFLDGGAGTNTLDGGADYDTVSFRSHTSGLTVTFSSTPLQNVAGNSLSNIESFLLTEHADDLTLTSAPGFIATLGGADTVEFGAWETGAPDWLYLSLGDGDDTLALSNGAPNTMLIGGDAGDRILWNGIDFVALISGANRSGVGADSALWALAVEYTNAEQEPAEYSEWVIEVSWNADGILSLGYIDYVWDLSDPDTPDLLAALASPVVYIADFETGDYGLPSVPAMTGDMRAALQAHAAAVQDHAAAAAFASDHVWYWTGVGATNGGSGASSGADQFAGVHSADTAHGLDGDDVLRGRGGADALYGDGGNDTLDGGQGADTLDGGAGTDTATYASSNTGVTVNLRTGAGSGGDAQGDTYALIENAIGSAFADTFVSSAAANTFTGGAGRDTISYAGSSAGVIVHMAAGLTWDGSVNDVISGIENMIGGGGNDQLWGDAGDNLIDGGVGGADVLAGFGGFDTVSYANSATGVIIDMGSSLTWDGVVNDQLHAFHGAIGSAHNDDFRGTGGVDVLDGGAGQDLYLGNDDADTFVFRAGQANGDTVVDFAGQGAVTGDSFVFVGYGAGAIFTQIDATHWLITSGNGLITETITLANSASVHASDYTFVDSYIVGGG